MASSELIPRKALAPAAELLNDARGIVVNGPRQSGKSELLRMLTEVTGGRYVTLDDPAELRAARTDPSGLLERLGSPFLIDEVQRGGDPLLLAIKRRFDENRSRGQGVLAGSTRFLFEPRISESLAGRVRFVELWPLSVGEIESTPQRFLDAVFNGPLSDPDGQRIDRNTLARLMVCGGFPESVVATGDRSRNAFFRDYAATVTQRDVRELSTIHHGAELVTIARLIAARTACELNLATFASTAGLGAETTRRYLPLLSTVYFHHLLPAWSNNFSARAVKRPKIHMTDSGLATHLLGVGTKRFESPDPLLGQLFETFVVNEVLKQRTWNETDVTPFHWREHSGDEVDLVLERPDGSVVGVECKLANDVDANDFKGLRALRDQLGDRFVRGVVVHLGERVRDFGDRLQSLPVATLWRTGAP